MSPAAEPAHRNGQKQQSDELHVKHRAERPDAVCREARGKVGATPADRGKQAEQDSHDGSGGLAFCAEAEDGHDFLKILPDLAFCVGIPQEISGMICGH
jgi:hypothetical protein